jgi:hypothetical protein
MVSRSRRGATLMWSVAGLALALALTPLYVRLCHSLAALTARGGHRLRATHVGAAELERLRAAPAPRAFAVPELPEGRCEVALRPAGATLREARVTVTWREGRRTARCEWVTLTGGGP